MATFNSARVRLLSNRSSFLAEMRLRAISFKVLNNEISAQNIAIVVWSGVRTVEAFSPSVLTSSSSRDHLPDLRSKGPGSRFRNCEGLFSARGVIRLAREKKRHSDAVNPVQESKRRVRSHTVLSRSQ